MTNGSHNEQAPIDAPAVGVDRRKLIRAGLASTPILLGLKSESALAGNDVVCKPSMWSSIKAAGCRLSRKVIAKKGTCTHYRDWAKSTDARCDHKFHDSYSSSGKSYTGAKFSKTYYDRSKSLKDICKSTGGSNYDELSRHCAAIYLQITVKGSASCPISLDECKAMWTACKGGGRYAPVNTNINWSAQDCIEYLSYLCGLEIPATC